MFVSERATSELTVRFDLSFRVSDHEGGGAWQAPPEEPQGLNMPFPYRALYLTVITATNTPTLQRS